MIHIKVPKFAGISASLLASLAFIVWMVRQFNLPMEMVWQFLLFCGFLLLVIVVIAVPIALIIRYFSHRSE